MTLRTLSLLLTLALVGCAPPETHLDVQIEPLPQDHVRIVGDTSLPDGAQLNVSLLRPGAADPLVVALPVVKQSRFEARLDPRTNLPAGDYMVRVEFSPRAFAWSEHVKPAVGANGEKLGGPLVHDGGEGYKVLRYEQALQLP